MARDIGVRNAGSIEDLDGLFDVVVDATNDPAVPASTLRWVEPGGQVVLIGLSGEPSTVDSREIVIGDVTVTGVLSGSAGISDVIRAYDAREVVPDRLVAEVITLEQIADRLRGERGTDAGPGPKVQVDPGAG